LVKIIAHRFDVFRVAFGRDPRPDEPLFFVPDVPVPTPAERESAILQLADSARATGVSFMPILKLIGIDAWQAVSAQAFRSD
jgi:hypothetical protein